jgi:ankyrin repeat protein
MDERSRRLQEALRQDDPQRVKQLLEMGADPDTEGPFGPVLLTALLLGHGTVARLLVEAGADLNISDDNGWTPLHWAAKAGDVELILAMVEGDGDLLALDREGQTPMDVLVKYERFEALERVRQEYPADTSPSGARGRRKHKGGRQGT